MKLFINGKEAHFSTEFDANMTFKFLDTYSPSAIKTSYSKTVSLPDCKENAEIFGDLKVKYQFELFADDGRIIEKGYCSLDNVRTEGLVKTYNITLYGGLGDFFYNLKGEEDSPKSLADMYWGDITELTKEEEDSVAIITWDPDYAFHTWISPEDYPLWDTFRAVPCVRGDDPIDKNKTIVPGYPNLAFPFMVQENGKTYLGYPSEDQTLSLLVETSNENTCYGRQDFRVDSMPLGIKYKSIIEMCCKPYNNGGYEVFLDPDFFNASNPYWTNTFVLKNLPIPDQEYNAEESKFRSFSSSLTRAGNYLADSTSSTAILRPFDLVDPWTSEGDNILVSDSLNLIGDSLLESKINLAIQIPYDEIPDTNEPTSLYLTSQEYIQIEFKAVNNDSGEEIVLASRGYNKGSRFHVDTQQAIIGMYLGAIVPFLTIKDLYPLETLSATSNIPKSWTNFTLKVDVKGNSTDFVLHYRQEGHILDSSKTIRGDVVFPTTSDFETPGLVAAREECYEKYSTGLWEDWAPLPLDSTLVLESTYSTDLSIFEPLNLTKQDIFLGASTPFDYLVWYTKMFNLRFYLEPGTKKVSILTADNFVRQLEPLDIQDRICYDREYTKTRKIIDEGYLKFNLDPAPNVSTKKYSDDVDSNLLDSYFAVPYIEEKGTKEYLNTGLKIGSKGRLRNSLSIRPFTVERDGVEESYVFYGFNQTTPYEVTYFSGSGEERDLDTLTKEYNLNYDTVALQRYDFLSFDDDLNNVLVMYSGLKDTLFEGNPAIISKTSADMVRFAGSPCYLGGFKVDGQGVQGSLIGAQYITTYKIPSYGLVPSLVNYDNGLSYSNVDYESLIVTGNIYDKYLSGFINRVYGDPLVVECYVRLNSPELRRLYWFDNNYWILTEISNYNYRDEPVKCKFLRYRTDA